MTWYPTQSCYPDTNPPRPRHREARSIHILSLLVWLDWGFDPMTFRIGSEHFYRLDHHGPICIGWLSEFYVLARFKVISKTSLQRKCVKHVKGIIYYLESLSSRKQPANHVYSNSCGVFHAIDRRVINITCNKNQAFATMDRCWHAVHK